MQLTKYPITQSRSSLLFYKHSIIELIKPLDIILTREQLVIKVNHSFLRKWEINDDQRIYENEKHDWKNENVMCYALCFASYVLFGVHVRQRFSLNVIEEWRQWFCFLTFLS